MARKQGQVNRVIIERVSPVVELGQFPVKRAVGDWVEVDAVVLVDGHDHVDASLLYRHESESKWKEARMQSVGNDHFQGEFLVQKLGVYYFKIEAWLNELRNWYHSLSKKVEAREATLVDLQVGVELLQKKAKGNVSKKIENELKSYITRLEKVSVINTEDFFPSGVFGEQFENVLLVQPVKHLATVSPQQFPVWVDRQRGNFSAWYEFFPRSASPLEGAHGTFKDAQRFLPYIASMGFDVVYLPPIHPIGHSFRKGRNNAPICKEDDVGSPWGIGAKEGGHKGIHPQLGTLKDFKEFLKMAKEFNLEVALDVAFQCSPDHPYVKEHEEWFKKRPDGSIQYAENPPKKYQDIYPINFESENFMELWQELKSVIQYWIDQGIKIFRVDNPHTKPLPFWEWLIKEVRKEDPSVLFLSEAFTRPNIMYHLAKVGFNQSYTYFTWRTTKEELTQYLQELTHTHIKEYFRPNFWPNTPDILSGTLRHGSPQHFAIRLVLAATLSSNYGIYGPAFEFCINRPRDDHSDEYLDSEKYELKSWNIDHPPFPQINKLIQKINSIRRENEALQQNYTLQFHDTDNSHLICYSKTSLDLSNVLLMVVNLDGTHSQSGWTQLKLQHLNLEWDEEYEVYDLLQERSYGWKGAYNYIMLRPEETPAHVFRIHFKRPKEFKHRIEQPEGIPPLGMTQAQT